MITFRYVPHDLVPSYLQCGWMLTHNFGDLGLPHSQYSAGMLWPCNCNVREPKWAE